MECQGCHHFISCSMQQVDKCPLVIETLEIARDRITLQIGINEQWWPLGKWQERIGQVGDDWTVLPAETQILLRHPLLSQSCKVFLLSSPPQNHYLTLEDREFLRDPFTFHMAVDNQAIGSWRFPPCKSVHFSFGDRGFVIRYVALSRLSDQCRQALDDIGVSLQSLRQAFTIEKPRKVSP